MDAAPLTTAVPVHPPDRRGDDRHTLRRLVTAVFDGADEHEVLWAAMAAIAATGPFAAEAAYVMHRGLPRRCPPGPPAAQGLPGLGAAADGSAAERTAAEAIAAGDLLDRRVRALDGRSRHLDDAGGLRIRAIALRDRDRCLGYLVVRVLTTPSAEETADADLLARQAGVALAGLISRRGEPARGAEREVQPGAGAGAEIQPARSAEPEIQPAPGAGADGPGAAPSVLASRNAFHEALSRAAASGRGEQGILQTLHEHTGLPAVSEDPFGNPRARAGAGGGPHPGPHPGPETGHREELLRSARRRSGAVRDRDRLVAPIEMAGDLLGLVALVDPDQRAAENHASALEQTGLVLAPQLSHERRLAELEPRLRHDLVEKLISGDAADDVFPHAASLGHDLHRPHKVAVLEWPGTAERAALGDAVTRAAGRLRLDVLIGARGGTTVALVAGQGVRDDLGDALYRAVSAELGDPTGAVGIGGVCESTADLPHSYDEAVRALTVRRRSQDPHGSTGFEDLGLCRMMGTGDGEREADRFVREWLGPLLDYDERHHTELATTLSRYLESGGSYDATSELLLIHRSTVRYRLQRIREITGHDLGDVETRLNLHVATRIRNVLDEPG
jgi:sugar diacid utilization regulator